MTRPIVSQNNFESRIREDALVCSEEGIDLEGTSFDPSADCFSKKQYYQYIENGYEWATEKGWYRDDDSLYDYDDDDDEFNEYGLLVDSNCPDPVGFRD
jgi:hypothetical protein